jgi:hypothetical protein
VRAGNGKGAVSDPWAAGHTDAARANAHLPANTDASELFSSTLFQVAGLYATMVAALLTIFIQQECGVTSCVTDTVSRTETCVTAHAPCSFSDNLRVNNGFGKLVVAFNFTTLAVFLVANAVFFFREKARARVARCAPRHSTQANAVADCVLVFAQWLITHFDTDTDLPIDNLTDGAAHASCAACVRAHACVVL